ATDASALQALLDGKVVPPGKCSRPPAPAPPEPSSPPAAAPKEAWWAKPPSDAIKQTLVRAAENNDSQEIVSSEAMINGSLAAVALLRGTEAKPPQDEADLPEDDPGAEGSATRCQGRAQYTAELIGLRDTGGGKWAVVGRLPVSVPGRAAGGCAT